MLPAGTSGSAPEACPGGRPASASGGAGEQECDHREVFKSEIRGRPSEIPNPDFLRRLRPLPNQPPGWFAQAGPCSRARPPASLPWEQVSLCSVDIGSREFFVACVLCIVGWVTASLASTALDGCATPLPSCDNQICLQTFPNDPRWSKVACTENHHLTTSSEPCFLVAWLASCFPSALNWSGDSL